MEIAALHKTPEVTFSIPQREGSDEVVKVNLLLMTMKCRCGVRRVGYRLRRIAVLADEGSPAVHLGGVTGHPSDHRRQKTSIRRARKVHKNKAGHEGHPAAVVKAVLDNLP